MKFKRAIQLQDCGPTSLVADAKAFLGVVFHQAPQLLCVDRYCGWRLLPQYLEDWLGLRAAATMTIRSTTTYAERLRTFEGFWDEHQTAARQLAAIGHVCDRPPLETLEEGSRCVSCSVFVRKDRSIKALGDVAISATSYSEEFKEFNFHHHGCIRQQVRIPLEPQTLFAGLYSYRFENVRSKWERRSAARHTSMPMERLPQRSSLFSLPTEIRLEIYAMILPAFERETEIVTLNGESARVVTRQGYEKTGPRDITKSNILRTCRAVNEEAMDLIYSHTAFKFDSTKVMYLFLHSVGQAGRRLIKAVDVHCGGREDAIAFAMLASCEKLRAITIRLPRPMMLTTTPPIWLVDGVSCLLALRGLEEVSFGPCGSHRGNCMSDAKPDATVIRTELARPRGTSGDDTIVRKYIDA